MIRWTTLAALLALLVPDALAVGDAPMISRHRGKRDGIVVLWPRVVPEFGDPRIDGIPEALQGRLRQLAVQAVPESKVDVRPRPERVCPRSGCRGVSLGVVLGHQDGGCFAVALVGPPDGGAVQMVPWAGKVLARNRSLPFRDPPENELLVRDFVPCDQLVGALDDRRLVEALSSALAAAASVGPGPAPSE